VGCVEVEQVKLNLNCYRVILEPMKSAVVWLRDCKLQEML
jgi:hypothetical protein